MTLRFSATELWFASSASAKAFAWAPRDEAGLRSSVLGALDLAKTEGPFQAGALLSLVQLVFRDPDTSAAVAALDRVLETAAAALRHPDARCVAAAACFLGIVLMHVRNPDAARCTHAERYLGLGVAEAVVENLRNLVDAHALYQNCFLAEVLGGASEAACSALVAAGVAGPLVAAMDSDARFGAFSVTARAALAIGGIFGGKEAKDGEDVRLDVAQAVRVCEAFAAAVDGTAPISPWLVAKNMGRLAQNAENRGSLHVAGAAQLLGSAVRSYTAQNAGSADAPLQRLSERWCARALVELCVDDKNTTFPVWLPSACTVAALFCGFYSAIGAPTCGGAAVAILLAVAFDVLDVASTSGTRSQFGQQYDALSDMVAFGVAPATLLYSVNLDAGLAGRGAAFLYLACAGARLSRTGGTTRFVHGLPSNVAAVGVVLVTCGPSIPPLAAAGVSCLLSLGMVSSFRQRNFLPDVRKADAAKALLLIGALTLSAALVPPHRVLLTAACAWAAAVLPLRAHKEVLIVLTLVFAGLAAALALIGPAEGAETQTFAVAMMVWFPFTRVATFASFLKVKKAQKVLLTHWVRVATGLDFHHFHLGALVLLVAALLPAGWPRGALTGVGLSYVLDQAVPVLVKTFGHERAESADTMQCRRCEACGRRPCPWRWGQRGLCYFAREATVAAAALHAIALWYVARSDEFA